MSTARKFAKGPACGAPGQGPPRTTLVLVGLLCLASGGFALFLYLSGERTGFGWLIGGAVLFAAGLASLSVAWRLRR
jgi:hypothetical protein